MPKPILEAPSHIKAPVAEKRIQTFRHHGTTIHDPWAWLKDPKYPEVSDPDILDYLKAENAYTASVMEPYIPLQNQIFTELKSRVNEEDSSVPWMENGIEYKWAYKSGAQYRIWFWRPSDSADWRVLLDENIEAAGKEYFRLGDISVSPDGEMLAWTADTNGSERFGIEVRDLATGKLLEQNIRETSGRIIWAKDSRHFFYIHVSEEWRPFQVWYHRVWSETSSDALIYEEKESGYFVGIDKSSSEDYLLIRSADHVSAELYALNLNSPESKLIQLNERRDGHDCNADHGDGRFIIRSNAAEVNFSLMTAPEAEPYEANWETLLEGNDSLYLRAHICQAGRVIVQERQRGLDQIRIIEGNATRHIQFPEAAYGANLGLNPDFHQNHIRISYESMVTPLTVFDYDIAADQLITRKTQTIPSGYNPALYETERLMVTVRDGVMVPVSIVYKKGLEKSDSKPLHLYGYGAYGLGMTPGFAANRISLLDRGFTYAIAHIRGGDDMGYKWYEDGKLTKRKNTFNDFVDCAKGMIERGYVKKGDISISGGSAGGELVGAVLNQAPELFRVAVLHVPFVDVLNTMLDDSLPLTPIEWPEWGNPITDPAAFNLIQSYSPYDQIRERAYPPMLVTGGLNDPRVTYWEPAKWTAKLRAMKSDSNLLAMRINMGAGHGGKSGRYERLHEVAEEYTFILMAFGKTEVP